MAATAALVAGQTIDIPRVPVVPVHTASVGGKPWRYVLIPHDEIAENMTLAGAAERFGAGEVGTTDGHG